MFNSTTNKDGGPAFPSVDKHATVEGVTYYDGTPGMTLRDYFAGQALAGFCAAGSIVSGYESSAAKAAYATADAMIAQREKGPDR